MDEAEAAAFSDESDSEATQWASSQSAAVGPQTAPVTFPATGTTDVAVSQPALPIPPAQSSPASQAGIVRDRALPEIAASLPAVMMDGSVMESAASQGAVLLTSGMAVVAPRVTTTTVSVALDFARMSGGWAGPLVFNIWLRRQLRERRMSQRQLAVLSGVNHSTISRLLNENRTPSLQTAAKLVHALRLEWTDEQVATYFDLLPERTLFPTQRVESALRGDLDLDDADVRELLTHYMTLRSRRRRAYTSSAVTNGDPRQARAGPSAASEP